MQCMEGPVKMEGILRKDETVAMHLMQLLENGTNGTLVGIATARFQKSWVR